MKSLPCLSILCALMFAMPDTCQSQRLHDILEGKRDIDESLALKHPILEKMVPQSGRPDIVLVHRINGINDGYSYCEDGELPMDLMTFEEADFEAYAFYGEPTDTIFCPFYERGTYLIMCLDKEHNDVGESLVVMINDNSVDTMLSDGHLTNGGVAWSNTALRIGREEAEYVCFN